MHQRLIRYLTETGTHGMEKISNIEGLGNVGDLPQPYFLHRWGLSTHEQRRRVFQMLKGVQLIVEFQTCHIWQSIIKNKEVGRMHGNRLQGLFPVQVMMSVMRCFLLNHANDEHADFLIIIDHKNELRCGRVSSSMGVTLVEHRKYLFFHLGVHGNRKMH
jgi:hypothetical protein